MDPGSQRPRGGRKRRRNDRDRDEGISEESEALAEDSLRAASAVSAVATANLQIPEEVATGGNALPFQNSNPAFQGNQQRPQSSFSTQDALLQALGLANPASRAMGLAQAAAASSALAGQFQQLQMPLALGANSNPLQPRQHHHPPATNYNLDARSLLLSQLIGDAARNNDTGLQARLLQLAVGLPSFGGTQGSQGLPQLGSQRNPFLSQSTPLRADSMASGFAGAHPQEHSHSPGRNPPSSAARLQPEQEETEEETGATEPSAQRNTREPPPPTGRGPVPLFLPSDNDTVSPYQCLARQQIEFFEAGETELTAGAQGRNRPIALGQVGIRCRFCANLEPRQKTRANAFYPSKLEGIYQAAQNIANSHLTKHCTLIPSDIRQQLVRLQAQKSARGGGKRYWLDAAARCGVYDAEDGIRFKQTTQSGR